MLKRDIQIGDILLHENGNSYEVKDIMIGTTDDSWDPNMVHKTIAQGGKLWYYAFPFPSETRSWQNIDEWKLAKEFVEIVKSVKTESKGE